MDDQQKQTEPVIWKRQGDSEGPSSFDRGKIFVALGVCLLVMVLTSILDISVPFSGYGVGATFCFHMCLQPRWKELLKVIVLVPVLGTWFFLFTVSDFRILNLPAFCALLGLSSFLLVALRLALRPAERKQSLRILVPGSIMMVFLVGMLGLPGLASTLYARTLDLYALVAEGSLGLQLSFVLAQFGNQTGIRWAEAWTYNAIPLPIIFTYAVHMRRRQTPIWEIISLFLVAGLVGYLLYLVFPVAGPRWAFQSYFPDNPLPLEALSKLKMEWIPVMAVAARNGVPSLHMGWALLAWWGTAGLSRKVRAVAFAWALVTAWDTMATGEHYVVDLVVAYPFALVILAFATRRISWSSPQRYVPAVIGAVSYSGWLLLIRYGNSFLLKSRVIPWTLIVATIVITEAIRSRMPELVADNLQDAVLTSRSSSPILEGDQESVRTKAVFD